MNNILDNLTPKERKIFDDNFRNHDLTAKEFFDKYTELTELQTMEIFAHIKTWQTQDKIQNMLWNESERLGGNYEYILRKAGNWVGCDWYRALIREDEKEHLDEYKEMWEEIE